MKSMNIPSSFVRFQFWLSFIKRWVKFNEPAQHWYFFDGGVKLLPEHAHALNSYGNFSNMEGSHVTGQPI